MSCLSLHSFGSAATVVRLCSSVPLISLRLETTAVFVHIQWGREKICRKGEGNFCFPESPADISLTEARMCSWMKAHDSKWGRVVVPLGNQDPVRKRKEGLLCRQLQVSAKGIWKIPVVECIFGNKK